MMEEVLNSVNRELLSNDKSNDYKSNDSTSKDVAVPLEELNCKKHIFYINARKPDTQIVDLSVFHRGYR